jgi:peroxiredoxin family protein
MPERKRLAIIVHSGNLDRIYCALIRGSMHVDMVRLFVLVFSFG